MGNASTKPQGGVGDKKFMEKKKHTDSHTKYVDRWIGKHSFSGKLVVKDCKKLCNDIKRLRK